jgi:hypothetical protein
MLVCCPSKENNMNLFDIFESNEQELDEDLRKWFKDKWVRFGPDGEIRGDCARGDDSEGKPKCLPQSKAQSLGKKGRASAAARKRREDPNPERSGKAINVATKKKSNEGVAEGSNDTVYPNATVIKSKNGRPVGEIYQDGNSWGVFHYRADRGYDFIDSREEAIEALKDLHQETGRSRPDYTIKGVAEGYDDWSGPLYDPALQGNGKKQRYEMMFKNGQVKRFSALNDNEARKIAAGHSAKSVIRMKGNVPSDKIKEQGVAEGLNEMDKTQTPPGRDGDIDWTKKQIHLGPEHTMKAKDVAKHALKALNKTMKKSHADTSKKKGVEEGYDDEDEGNPVMNAIISRIMRTRPDLLDYDMQKLQAAIRDVALDVGDVDEIGSSDISGWVKRVEQNLSGAGVTEAINPDITNPEFSHQQQIGDYLYVARYWSKGLKITAYDGAKKIGYAELMYQSAPFDDFADPKTTPKRIWLESEWTKVDPKYQRQGIMSTMYAYAKMLGNSVKPSQTRSDDAKAAWKSWRDAGDAQHLTREGVTEEFGPLPKDNQQIRLGRHTVDIERVGLGKDYFSFAWHDSQGQEHYEEVPVSDLGSYDDLIDRIKQEISYQERQYTDQGVAEGLVGDVVVHNYTKIPIDLEPGQAQIAGWGPNDEPLYRVKGQDGKEVKTWSKRRMLTIAKEQGVAEEQLDEKCWDTHKQVGMKKKGNRMVPNCVPKESIKEMAGKTNPDAVRRIQQLLNKKFDANLDIDGILGPLTLKSIKKFLPKSTEKQAPNPEKTTAVQGKQVKEEKCPHCGGEMVSEELINEKKDACYYKVKSRYKVWPSAYASGALVKCRKKGAKNWGNKSEGVAEGLDEMDKTQTPPGRDGDIDWTKKQIHLGPERMMKAKDVAKHALKALDKTMKKSTPKKKGVAEGLAQDESEQSHGWVADSIDEINYNTFEVHLTNTRSGESADLVIRPVDMMRISGKLQIETIDVRDLATGDTQSWTTEMPDPQGAIVDAIDALFWDNPQLNKKLYAIIDAHSKKGQDMLPGQKNRAKVGMAAPADQFIAGQDAIAKAKGTVKEFDAQGFQQRYTLYKDGYEIEKFGDMDDAIEYAEDDRRDGDDPSAVYKIVDINKQVVWDSNPYEKPSRIQLRKPGVAEDQVNEKWTQKYKDSINCSNPKGFSQKAHCAGEKKNEDMAEGKEYYTVTGTDSVSLRRDFNMSKDRNGWYLREGATPKQKLEAFRAFGSPKLKEFNLAAFSGGTQTKGDDNVISPVGSQTRAQYKK